MLPEAFAARMKIQLGDEYPAFLATFAEADVRGARVNRIKANPDDFVKGRPEYKKLPYSDDGFILASDEPVGRTPEHHAGIIYMQDPGAMAPVCAIDVKEGDFVLDLCSAPGGKSGQAAARIGDTGFILSNEYVAKRAKITVANFERLGIRNALVTNLDTSEFKKLYRSFFDVVIADVPCSGEGMFRKNSAAIDEWSEENVTACAERQKIILENAAPLVKGGGIIVYSTCTYSEEENEDVIFDFLTKHGDFEIICAKEEIIKATHDGINRRGEDGECLKRCRRFYPHVSGGEGQFLAILRRKNCGDTPTILYKTKEKPLEKSEKNIVDSFIRSTLKSPPDARCVRVGDNIVLISHGVPVPPSSVFSAGVLLGEIRGNVLIPSHQFFSAYGNDFIQRVELSDTPDRLMRYLRGEEIEYDGKGGGFCVLTYLGAALGGGKIVGGRIKNHYPKGLRNN